MVARRKKHLISHTGRWRACALWRHSCVHEVHFGLIHAAYGGVFILLALLWGWKIDDVPPNTHGVIGAVLAVLGVGVMMY
jgi:drug/metabolite transporter superfamily protein YnfA